ncbi:unnamed protein product [Acanthoscelides obtectus]|uniref:Uncharacterized protein n=1 Tax=Acanthoscelides obtectus TaxID=200917 RepID=A0A9P0KBF3_ACAOB|nr:unnamed protein product [Acanthoscelides obtectus]CAK1660853.1 hypothetical protein AOBTE_LOCUS22297 [Acanthoscelides obtectus]
MRHRTALLQEKLFKWFVWTVQNEKITWENLLHVSRILLSR